MWEDIVSTTFPTTGGFQETAARPSSIALPGQGSEPPGEKDERFVAVRQRELLHVAHDDPVVAGRVFCDDPALERGERAGKKRHARATGMPVQPGKRSAPGGVARATNASCSALRMLTPNWPVFRMRDHVSDAREGETRTSGGSSETELNELTITPAGSPAGAPVTNVTPVANLESASRNERGLGGSLGSWGWAAIDTSVQRCLLAQDDLGEVVVGAVGGERVHE